MRLGSLGPVELILIVLVIVMIFGASKLGDIGGALGKSVKEFKKATTDEERAAAAKLEEEKAAARREPVVVTSEPAPMVSANGAEKAGAAPVSDFRPPDAKAT